MTDDERAEGSAFTYDVAEHESVTSAVVRAVAAVSGKKPVPDGDETDKMGDALPPLCETIDPDALEAAVRSIGSRGDRSDGLITFRYHGREVSIRGDGRIRVAERPAIATEIAD